MFMIATVVPQAIQDQKQAMIEDLEDKVKVLLKENAACQLATKQAKEAAEQAAQEHEREV